MCLGDRRDGAHGRDGAHAGNGGSGNGSDLACLGDRRGDLCAGDGGGLTDLGNR